MYQQLEHKADTTKICTEKIKNDAAAVIVPNPGMFCIEIHVLTVLDSDLSKKREFKTQ